MDLRENKNDYIEIIGGMIRTREYISNLSK